MAGLIAAALLPLFVLWATYVPTADDVRLYFDQAQKFYASGAYDQAIEKYEEISRLKSRFLRFDRIEVEVGEIRTPVRDVSVYQIGNSYLKMAQEEAEAAKRARSPKDKEKRLALAQEYFGKAAYYFTRTASEAKSEKLRVLAQNQLISSYYESENYDKAVEEAEKLIIEYPNSRFVEDALYNMAWSYYELKDYDRAIEKFSELIERFPVGYRADRALFQIGECYYDQGRYAEAIGYYQKLVDQKGIENVTEKDIMQMRREKLRRLVEETVLELVAKAQIKVGDCYAKIGELDKATEAYERVITHFSSERGFVEDTYIRMADMYLERGDLNGAIRVYKQAIDRSPDQLFKAKMQFLLAKRYYDSGYYSKAIDEYRLYIDAYSEVASFAGFPVDNAMYKIGRAFYEIGQKYSSEGQDELAKENYRKAISEYRRILSKYPEGDMVVAAKFNIALCNQMIWEEGSIAEAIDGFKGIVEEHPGSEYVLGSLFQMGRIYYKLQKYDEALDVYRSIIASYPDSPLINSAYFEMGLCFKDKGDSDNAVVTLLKVDSKSDLFEKSRLEVGEILIRNKRYADAIGVIEEALKFVSDPEVASKYRYSLGRAYSGEERYEDAIREFTFVIENSPDEKLVEGSLYGRGVAYFTLERYPKAEEDFRRLVSETDNKALRKSSEKMLGMARIKLHKERDALENYRSLADSATDPFEKADYLLLLDELYYGLEEYPKVVEVSRMILSLDFEDTKAERPYFLKEKAYYLMADSYNRMNSFEDVIAVANEGLNSYPSSYYSADMLFLLGAAYFRTDDYESAISTFDRFLSEYPRDQRAVYAYYYMGYSYFNIGDYERSSDVFAKAVERYPDSDVAAEMSFRAGESFFNLGEYERAIDFYSLILRNYRSSPEADDALYNTAWAHLEMGNKEEALSNFRALLKEFPDSEFAPSVQFTLGDFYYNEQEYRKALEEYENVLRKYPDSEIAGKVPEIMKELREIVAYLDYEKALEVFNSAVADKDEDKFKQAISMFQEIVDKHRGTESEIGALNNMGICYEYLGRWQEASDAFGRVLAKEGIENNLEAYNFAKVHKDWIEVNRL